MSNTQEVSAAEDDGRAVHTGAAVEEDRIRRGWVATDLQAELSARRATGSPGARELTMYDGLSSPFGRPHFGHLLSGFVKDALQRYHTMRGDRVRHRYAWDCHIQPIEGEVEAQFGVTRRQEIAELGVDNFVAAAAAAVDRHAEAYRSFWWAQARSTDFDDDIRTYRPPYMESVLWAFAELWRRGHIRRGHKVLDYCWNCEVPLSKRETRMGPTSRRQRTQLTLAATLVDGPEPGAALLVTVAEPWRLLDQVAVGVRRDARYVAVTVAAGPLAGRRMIVAEDRMSRYHREIGVSDMAEAAAFEARLLTGADLVGARFQPQLAGTGEGTVVEAGYALSEDGTGIVSLAPTADAIDATMVQEAGLPEREPAADRRGVIGSAWPRYAGRHLLAVSPMVLGDLEMGTTLVRAETRDHALTGCLRCAAELIQYPVAAWFVSVGETSPLMLELADQIRWLPGAAVRDMFTQWVGDAREWCVSRNRFWGTPVPVWVSDDPDHPRVDVYGSLDELERDFGVRPGDLHRPTLDALTRPNPDDPNGNATMRRVPEVLSCWFESGSLPFAELHYPFENAERFDPGAPGTLVVENIAQTKGWFYALHTMSTLLFARPAFRTCIGHGMVLGPDGRKMNGAAGNVLDVDSLLRNDGADALRWYLFTSTVLRGGNAQVSAEGVRDAARQVLIPIRNTFDYYVRCARVTAPPTAADDDGAVLDRYLLASAHSLVADVRVRMDGYDIAGACDEIRTFLDTLTRFHVRGSRVRLALGDAAALETLRRVLEVLSRLLAPFAPLLSERVWRAVTGGRSVHLAPWPDPDELPADAALVAELSSVRALCTAARAIRRSQGIRLRQPLSEMVVSAPDTGRLTPYAGIMAREVNVKAVRFTEAAEPAYVLRPNPRQLGPRLGAATQQVLRAAKAGAFVVNDDGTVAVAGETLTEGEFELRRVGTSTGVLVEDHWQVTLDTAPTAELTAEGFVRDVIHLIREERKRAALDTRQVVGARLWAPADLCELATANAEHIGRKTGTDRLEVVPATAAGLRVELTT